MAALRDALWPKEGAQKEEIHGPGYPRWPVLATGLLLTALAALALLALAPWIGGLGPEQAQAPSEPAPAQAVATQPPSGPAGGNPPETIVSSERPTQVSPRVSPARPPEPEPQPSLAGAPRRDDRTTGQEAPARAPMPAPAELTDDAVATADDWPAPDFEDLRTGAPKSVVPSLRAVQLVLVGQPGYQVGEGVDLVVVASHDTPLTVCVDGPERGTIWRGAVPAGRTALTRGGRQQAFAFVAPGTYRFSVSPTGQPRCTEAIHVVEVEVGR